MIGGFQRIALGYIFGIERLAKPSRHQPDFMDCARGRCVLDRPELRAIAPGTGLGQFLREPLQSSQPVPQRHLRIAPLFGNQPDRPGPSALLNHPQHRQFVIPLRRRNHLLALYHSADIHRHHIRLHSLPPGRKIVDVSMSVAEVVNHADVCDPFLLEPFDDGNLVVRLAEPVVVIVQLHPASGRGRQCHNPGNPLRLDLDALRLFLRRLGGRPTAHHP